VKGHGTIAERAEELPDVIELRRLTLDLRNPPARRSRSPARAGKKPQRGTVQDALRADAPWPNIVMARDLAGTVLPVSEAVILQLARKHSVGRKYGRVIGFSPDDVQQLHEALECPSISSVGLNRPTGSSAAPSAESALKKALALATSESPKKSERNAKPKSSQNQSTVVALHQHSPRLP